MATAQLASGNNQNCISPRRVNAIKLDQYLAEDAKQSPRCEDQQVDNGKVEAGQGEVTPQMIDDNEAKMKERIAQCKNIIDSLKIELNEEKAKMEKQSVDQHCSLRRPDTASKSTTNDNYLCVTTSDEYAGDLSFITNMYSECVDNKLNCDENLMEYEKQLEKYQNTLNLAQIEKKNAIRKQMLSKVYRLKLLEVENQCNIEMLRIKQNLQCLEPLKIIVSKWKNNMDEMYDVNSYDPIPRYPELYSNSCSEIASYELDIKAASEQIENPPQEDDYNKT
ncbi:hypothetical protein PYW07_001695 [Mythimna separata]|uniref:Uncharacterized protein n=1 Tax=Mythimna separata TaxID=271217 RepID=A0AAD7YTL9_MYTSE|nr:hypothetical protein PYW07_001695 [Mythimna separata]